MACFFDVIVIGGGPAGLTAAIYARRAGRGVLVLEKGALGGQIIYSPKVDNFPGSMGISGAELAQGLLTQAEALGAEIRLEEALELRQGEPKTVITGEGAYTCGAVILATGMKNRTLGLPGEDTLTGISYCAVCDGAFYRGKDVAVCGGGNTAVEEALFLSELCQRVYLIHRRAEFRADPILLRRVEARGNVTVCPDTVITGLTPEGNALRGLELRGPTEERSLPVEGLFVAIGHLPETGLAKNLTDSRGFFPAGEDCRLEPGIFAAGDCRAKNVRQLLTACADGAVAALNC